MLLIIIINMPRTSRKTKQKELLWQEIQKHRTFFSAEELYGKMKKKDPALGIATVYRFLNELRKEKKIFCYSCNRCHIYSTNNKSHCHFICEETGKVIHFDIDTLDFLKKKIPGSIISFQIEVKGICHDCKEA